jgi:hypothetical protein
MRSGWVWLKSHHADGVKRFVVTSLYSNVRMADGMRIMSGILAACCLLLCSCSKKQTSKLTDRLAWHNQMLAKAYDTGGHRNPKWDEAAHKALLRYAQSRTVRTLGETRGADIGSDVQDAVNAGCDDPMIRYLYCRFAPDNSTKPLKVLQDDFRKAALGLESSGYAPLLKFYANDRAAMVLYQERDRALWKEVVQFRRAAMADITSALEDKTLPIEEVWDAVDLLIRTVSANETEFKDAYGQIEGPLFRNWPDSAIAYMIKGRFYYEFAWHARGGGTADKVTEQGWKDFREDLAVAETAYRKAWNLDPHNERIANQMIEMAVSQQKDRTEMELWFQRAMEADTNNYTACLNKLRYLDPKWNGTPQEMIAFGKECVASKKWGGEVPLTLAEAHRRCAQLLTGSDLAAYWRVPEVWSDIQASYDKYFELHPKASSSIHYPYAWYAFRCGQMKDFTYQVQLIRDADGTVKSNYFGGDGVFNKLVDIANSESSSN